MEYVKLYSNPIKICVISSNNDVFLSLNNVNKIKRNKGRSIDIINKSYNETLLECNVLYIDRTKEQYLDTILKKLNRINILTISDINYFVEKGGMIGFFEKDGAVRFSINKRSSDKSGIFISSKLLKLAKKVIN